MAVFKCKMCGGTIEFNQGDTVGVCNSCGAKQTLPRPDDDKKADFYDRANHFREKTGRILSITIPAVIAVIAVLLVATKIITPNNNHKDEMELLKAASVGDVVCFGTYEQDNDTSDGAEAIEWQVLVKENNRILVISKYGLDCQQYNASNNGVTWEDCTLRTWLNKTFFKNAFSVKEQAAIAQTTVTADENPKFDTDPGNATTDRVFLLSINEANKYFSSDSARQCEPTAYAVAKGAYVGDSGNCWWWLRSPGDNRVHATGVSIGGLVSCYGGSVGSDNGCVRPALWINLDS